MFWKTSIVFSIMAAPIYILTNNCTQGFPFSTSFPTLAISCLFNNSYSDRCEMTSHCGFDFYFPDDYWSWASFHVPVSNQYVFFGKMSTQFLGPFLKNGFRVFCGSTQILVLFVLFLWKMSLEFWWGLHWICRLLWTVWTF